MRKAPSAMQKYVTAPPDLKALLLDLLRRLEANHDINTLTAAI
jgi:hypothetical protein